MANQTPDDLTITPPTPDDQAERRISNLNPANSNPYILDIESGARKRVAVSSGRRKLEVPEIPGYNQYWFLERNVEGALQGGYEFVESDKTILNQHGLANSIGISGNTDLGSRVSIATTAGNGAERLYLMKIRLAWFKEDQRSIAQQNANKLSAIFRDEHIFTEGQGQEGGSVPNRDPNVYFHESNSFKGNVALFSRGRRKAR